MPMPQKIFIDANVIIDLINADNDLNKPVSLLFSRILNNKETLFCSPTTFAITYYFVGKKIKNKTLLNEKIVKLFSVFTFTREDKVIMQKVRTSSFTDLEDALQYYSALDADVDCIITKNHFDFFKSAIPVYHPLQYISEFL
jgi:predicted nucleic acid-binding protein